MKTPTNTPPLILHGITKVCPKCGQTFVTDVPKQVYCTTDCRRSSSYINQARTLKREEAKPHFIGVDGEGMMIDGEHRYVLLSVGDRSLERGGQHLHIAEIFEFLWQCFLEQPDAVYVGYYLGYDFNQWLKTLPESRARMLLLAEGIAKRQRTNSGGNPTPFPVYWNEWEFDTLGLRKFKLRRKDHKSWMTICDTGAFFQMSFLKASDQSQWKDKDGKPILLATPAENVIIERGKAKRSTAVLNEDMIEYNKAENTVLSRMMDTLAAGMKEAGIKLSRGDWYGPGRAAQAWMLQHNNHTSSEVNYYVPKDALQMGRNAYFGGWFEITHHGHISGKTYEYDINSAYPNIHATLPCLLHGEWKIADGKPSHRLFDNSSRYTLVQARVTGSNPFLGTMLHRTNKGSVLRPHATYGTYWLHELEAAVRAELIDNVEYHIYCTYRPCSCLPPMDGLVSLYKQRLLVGKNTPEGKALKLIYNSAYGKVAQSIGKPKFANPIHASLITAGTRAMILNAIATHPGKAEAVQMIATDGIYFSEQHPKLNLGSGLGQWEESVKSNMLLVMPGLYWDDNVRSKRTVASIKSRGVNAEALLAMIDTFDNQFDSLNSSSNSWPEIEVPIRFAMTTAKQALQRNDWSQCGHVATDAIRVISADPSTKRDYDKTALDTRPIRTKPFYIGEESVPYSGTFGTDWAAQKDAAPMGESGIGVQAEWADAMNDLRS